MKFKTEWVGFSVKTNIYERESTTTAGKKRAVIFIAAAIITGIVLCGCAKKAQEETPTPEPQTQETSALPEETKTTDIDIDTEGSGKMVSYDVMNVGRADPFMPYGELSAYNEARNSAIAEANAYNTKLANLKKLKGTVIREKDDINPYSFNLPVPPTSLAPETSAAAKITRTKVVGIMYNETSPSAIINVDDKDYLVRTGDKIIDQTYKVMKINPNWITVSLGSNVYSAAIGELFSKEDISKYQNDLYNLKNRFGGRKG